MILVTTSCAPWVLLGRHGGTGRSSHIGLDRRALCIRSVTDLYVPSGFTNSTAVTVPRIRCVTALYAPTGFTEGRQLQDRRTRVVLL